MMTTIKHRPAAFGVLFSAILTILLFSLSTLPAHAQTSVIEMTTEKPEITLSLAGTGNATIDWGTGTPQTIKLTIRRGEYSSPTGLPAGPKTIRITAVNGDIMDLDCGGNGLTSLDLKGATALTWLDCSANDLTSLDLSNNKALEWLNCSWNEINANALNRLFSTLPFSDSRKKIDYSGNPDNDMADIAIAHFNNWHDKDEGINPLTGDPYNRGYNPKTGESYDEECYEDWY